jgi:hypothetical protein
MPPRGQDFIQASHSPASIREAGGYIVGRNYSAAFLGALASCLIIPQSAWADGDLNKVNHIIIVMQENHSFDNYFGALAYAPASPYHAASGSHSMGFLNLAHDLHYVRNRILRMPNSMDQKRQCDLIPHLLRCPYAAEELVKKGVPEPASKLLI